MHGVEHYRRGHPSTGVVALKEKNEDSNEGAVILTAGLIVSILRKHSQTYLSLLFSITVILLIREE